MSSSNSSVDRTAVQPFALYTLGDLRAMGDARFAADEDSVSIVSRTVWRLLESSPAHRDELPAAATFSRDGRCVAVIALVNQPVIADGATWDCLFGHDLYAHEPERQRGVGGILMREMLHALAGRGIPFAAYGATPAANDLMAALKMRRIGRVPRYLLPLRSGPVVRRFLRWRALAVPASALADVAVRALTRRMLRRLHDESERYRAVEMESLPADPATPQGVVRVARTRGFLDAKLALARQSADARLLAFVDAEDAVRGHCVLHNAVHETVGSAGYTNVRLCRVLDLAPPDLEGGARAALFHIISMAEAQTADVIELISSDLATVAACACLGWRQSNGYDLMLSPANLPDAVLDLRNWSLAMIESESAFG